MGYKCKTCGHEFSEDEALLFDDATDEPIENEKDDGSDYAACPKCGSSDLIYDFDPRGSSSSNLDGFLSGIIWTGIIIAGALLFFIKYAKENPEDARALIGFLVLLVLSIGTPLFFALRKRKKEKPIITKKNHKVSKELLIIIGLIVVITIIIFIALSNPSGGLGQALIPFIVLFVIISSFRH